MARRFLALFAVLGVVSLAAAHVDGQAPAASSKTTTAAKAAAKGPWTPPRTPDGQPDLQGYWTNATYTPLERPAELAGKEFFTPAEAAAYEQRRLAAFLNQSKDNIHYDDAIWQTERYTKGVASLRTSLIVEPRDGRIPPLTPEAQKRAAERAARRPNPGDAAEYRSLAERCITWGADVPPMLPPGYGANLGIFQGPGYVAILTEHVHGLRLIPLDGRPHLDANFRNWIGDSRGRWQGNTLVVETTNYSDRTNVRGLNAGPSPTLKVTERFTPVDPDTIRYEFTVDDPTTWTRSWSGELPIRRMEGPIYEYACQEGNYGLRFILEVARSQDKAAAASQSGNRVIE